MGVVGTLSGCWYSTNWEVDGADGLGFEDEESSMSVSEFKYAVYSGNLWSECVELEDELFVVDDGE